MDIEINVAVITVSDSRTTETDIGGKTLIECLETIGARIFTREIVADTLSEISSSLIRFADEPSVNLIVTTGGTGLAPRDNTPEATLAVIEREVRGISEAMRSDTLKITRRAMLSRGVSGIRNRTLIINFPGAPKGVAECFEAIRETLPHAVRQTLGLKEH